MSKVDEKKSVTVNICLNRKLNHVKHTDTIFSSYFVRVSQVVGR